MFAEEAGKLSYDELLLISTFQIAVLAFVYILRFKN